MCIPSGFQKARTHRYFRYQVEEGVKALKIIMISRMSVHLVHKPAAQRILITLLTDYVQQLLKLHRIIYQQFLRYQTVLGTSCDEGNLILSGKFEEAVFSGT
jgi:hypothetical protein